MKKNTRNFIEFFLTVIATFFLVATLVFAAGGSINVGLQVNSTSLCTDLTANNYGDPLPCTYGGGGGGGDIYGCMDPSATNYDPLATKSNDSCIYLPVVLGCTDSLATNYNALANKDDGSCQYPEELMGCTDRNAINYDQNAKKDDGSCVYRQGVPNVSDFSATFVRDEQKIYLVWTRPRFSEFKTVRIVRSTYGIPSNPTDGAVVYEGSDEQAVDPAVEFDIRYYYTAFVENLDGEYSSGAVASAIGLKLPDEPPYNTTTPPIECDDLGCYCSGGNCSNDPFITFPFSSSTDPELAKLKMSDFVLRQDGELSKYFGSGSLVKIKGNKNTIFEVEKESMPAVLKTIGVVISDPKNIRRSFSFILHDTGDGKYSATLSPFWRNGIFPVTIYVINYQDQTIKRITGRLQVAGVSFIDRSAMMAVAQKYVDPAVTALGLGAGLSQALLIGSNVNSFYDFFLLLMRLSYSFLSWLGIRRKRPEWGTVYDAITKQPIDPAYVTVQNVAGQEVTSAITDIDGRFGFLLPKDVYYIKAGKTNYLFPSKTLIGKKEDELYENLYFGTPLAHDGNQIIKLNIPMDPVGFDWNEFAKSQMDFFKIYTKKEAYRRRVLSGIFYVGLALSLFKSIVAPSALDFVLLGIYIAILIYQRYLTVVHKIVSVRKSDGTPLMFSLVRFYLPGIDQPIKSVTTDRLGRLYVLIRPGNYYLTVEEKKADGSYQKIYQSENINMPKGVLDNDIVI